MNSLRAPRLVALLLAILLGGGCVHRPTIVQPENLRQHQQQIQAVTDWQLRGKLGIRTPDDSGSASLKWQQKDRNYQIDLSGPLGQKRLLISGQPGKVRLEQSGEPTQEARSPEALIKQQLGWTLPVTQLAYWVRGVPAPKGRIRLLEQDSNGLIARLQQGDWVITYSKYNNQSHQGVNLALPGKITAEYRDIRLILAIRQWQLGPAAP